MNLLVDQFHPLVLNVGLAVHNADWNWKKVNSPFWRLFYVTEGTAQIVLPTGTQTLKPDNLYFIPSFTEHSYICHSHFTLYYLHIYEECQQGNSLLDEWDLPTEVPANELTLPLIKRLCSINPHMALQKSDPATYDNNSTLMRNLLKNKQRILCDKVESRGIVYQLLSCFMQKARPKVHSKDSRIANAINFIRKHINENINIDMLSADACLSKDHFIRLFKQEIGTTPLKYINEKKIEKAQLLLVTDDISIKNIAFTLSFEDYSYFNRLFKKITGVTPQEYKTGVLQNMHE